MLQDVSETRTDRAAVNVVIAEVHRREWAAVVATVVRVTRDLDVAEECTQDAFARALETWPRSGVPSRPGGWLTAVAVNRARDLLRRDSVSKRALPLLVVDDMMPGPEDAVEWPALPDDRLRLIFTCCHPALSREAQVALTLRLVCGLTMAEVASAFLVRETTMAARITRGKRKIAAAGIPFRIPPEDELSPRVGAVCEVLHLVFTTGHTAPNGDRLVRAELIESAIQQTRALHQLLPADGEVGGLLALMLLIDARRSTRQSASGALVLLREQDRGDWDSAQIAEGIEIVSQALRRSPRNRYAVEAAIAAVHAEARQWDDTDWVEIVGLYDVLGQLWPSPVVELNRAIAVGFRDGPQAGLDALEPLLREPALATYGYLSAARAHLFSKLQRWAPARDAYEEALALTGNVAERAFLDARLAEIRSHLV